MILVLFNDGEMCSMKIVVNADDFGMSHHKNVAIDYVMRREICTNTSLTVNMPASEEAASLAINNGYKDRVSLHLNLTEGKALTEDIQQLSLYYDIRCGCFAYRPIIKMDEQIMPKYIDILRQEIEAQIMKFQRFGFELKSIDSHNWIHLRIPVWQALEPLIKKYNVKIVRPMWEGYKRADIASEKWCKYFAQVEPILLETPECRVFKHTSNIEQFILNKERMGRMDVIEVFTHPDIIEGKIMDISSSYTGKVKETVENNVSLLSEYSKITVSELINEENRKIVN